MSDGCARCNDDLYEELLNEVYEDVTICGFTQSQGTLLREIDPIAFSCGMSEEEENLCEECQKEFD